MKESKFKAGDEIVITGNKGSSHGFPIGTKLIISSVKDGRSKRCLDLGVKVVTFVGKSRSAYDDEIDFDKITTAKIKEEINGIVSEITKLEERKSSLERQKALLTKRKKKEVHPDDMKVFLVADELERELKIDSEKSLSLAKTLLDKNV